MRSKPLTFLQRILDWRVCAAAVLLVLSVVELIVAMMDVAMKGGVVAVDLFIGLVAVILVALPVLVLLHYLLRLISKAQQRKLEDSAHQANARLNLVLENARMIVWDIDLARDVIHVEDETLGLLGMSASNAPHDIHSLVQRIHPDDRANFVRHFQAALESAAPPFSVEYRVAQQGGDWGWVHSTGKVVLRDAAGKPLTVVGSTININARKQAEMQLSENREILAEREELFRSIFAQANDGILLIDPQTLDFVEFNDVACANLGYSREEFARLNVAGIQAEMDRAQIEDRMRSLKVQGAMQFETLHRHKDGSLRNVRISSRAISLRGRDYVVATSADITERKKMETELRAFAGELAKANMLIEAERATLAERVAERTAQLEYANKAKDSFLATMSHEIRTPLGGLLGMMELLGLTRLDKQQRDTLAAARKSGNSLLRIVDDILDWSRIEAGKLVLAPHAATLSVVLQGVIDTYAQLAAEKGITLKLEVDVTLDERYIFDALRVSQILNNFTSNAIKFAERGEVRIGAQRLGRYGGYDTVRFSVRDNGIGMDKEQ